MFVSIRLRNRFWEGESLAVPLTGCELNFRLYLVLRAGKTKYISTPF